ncbi:site-2 protease family protein [Streptomyces sp. TRM64462]|uniref:site-2 protease family protein n=1 Tax=Streptomyces sp. TRM64462 TaxID=2741726 RepID=UPI001586566A|nr:site-2 protease family protein [Streptomyces sp. TRM64462]
MKATFSLGRLGGVRVGVHWSVLVIVAVVAVALAGRLPDAHPGRPTWAYLLTGLGAAVVFLLCLLAHELSHAVVARRHGVAVEDITLWLLGGVARLRSEARSPGAEVRIAAVGPLVSLVLGLVFGLAAVAAAATAGAGLLVEALVWLAVINGVLAVFNALPAAPLDGGRLLRALVWHRTGDPLRATAVATRAGRALGWVLIGTGLFLIVVGALFSGFWLVVIGWFLVAMATGEGARARARELLGGIPVGQVMSVEPTVVPDSMTVGAFLADPGYRFHHSAFPVVDRDRRPVGLVEVKAASRVPEEDRDAPVTSAMLPVEDVPTARPDDSLVGLLEDLESSTAHRALVLEDGRLVGMVTSSDISRVTSWLASSSSWRGRAF